MSFPTVNGSRTPVTRGGVVIAPRGGAQNVLRATSKIIVAVFGVIGSVVVTAGALLIAPIGIPSASAQPCPDVEVLFARGTGEEPGVGPTGQAFVNALRSRIGAKSLGVYPVNYPATDDWPTGIDGVRDASTHIMSTAQNCPKTRMVLGGFSQGAAVIGFVTSSDVPTGVDPATVPKPLQPEVADNVAAVTLYGTPNARAMNFLGEPAVVIGPLYQAKTIELCATEDPICSDGLNFAAHDGRNGYTGEGMIDQGADYAASRI